MKSFWIVTRGLHQRIVRIIGERDVATLLAHTLGEEESSDFLLTELSKPLMQLASSEDAGTESKTGRTRKQKA